MAETVLFGIDRGVGRLTINRPSRRNALSAEVIAGMRDALAAARVDETVRVVVLTGAGDRAFCAGADLSEMPVTASGDQPVPSRVEVAHLERGELVALFEDLWGLGKPTVARVQGYALGGGFGLALACDFVVAAEDSVFGTPEIDVGLWPYMVTVPLLRSMPPKKALELMLTARRVSAHEALEIGFVNRVVPPAGLDEAVDALTEGLVSKPPTTVRLGRDSFYAVLDLGARDALRILQPMLTIASMTDDAAEGVAAFRAKRPPRWRN